MERDRRTSAELKSTIEEERLRLERALAELEEQKAKVTEAKSAAMLQSERAHECELALEHEKSAVVEARSEAERERERSERLEVKLSESQAALAEKREQLRQAQLSAARNAAEREAAMPVTRSIGVGTNEKPPSNSLLRHSKSDGAAGRLLAAPPLLTPPLPNLFGPAASLVFFSLSLSPDSYTTASPGLPSTPPPLPS